MDWWLAELIFFMATLAMSLSKSNDVMTPSGPIKGTITMSFTAKIVHVYYGIPYAEPPIGKLRFGAPVKKAPWTEQLNATVPTPACYQRRVPKAFSFSASRPWTEDCLKLHIWVPFSRPQNSTVMVYIHGGGFAVGSPLSQSVSGATIAAEENVIVVSMNYRLDVHGFLYFGIPEVPGNQALLDQQLALQWVLDNIASFGGNPDAVTIFGLSAGAASVGYQILAPSSRKLFKRAIMMSGTPNAIWANAESKEVVLEKSKHLIYFCGCQSHNITESLECMQNVHPEKIREWNTYPFSWKTHIAIPPVVDGNFIPHLPWNSESAEHPINQVDVMIGNTVSEGGTSMLSLLPEITKHPDGRVTTVDFKSAVKRLFKEDGYFTREIMSFLYTNWTHPDDPFHLRDGLVDLISDGGFNCAAQEFSDILLASGSRVYRYIIDHVSEIFDAPKWMKASHGMDVALHFGIAAGRENKEEAILSRKMMRWFANFARQGDPNNSEEDSVLWPPSTIEKREYLHIAPNPRVETNFRTKECGLFTKIMDEIIKRKLKCSS